jgi:hypothetical protein
MSALEVSQVVALVLVGIAAGNDVGTWTAVHPALGGIPLEADVPAHRAIIRRYGYFMPWFGPLTLAWVILVAVLSDDAPSSSLTFAIVAAACFFGWQMLNLAVGRLSLQLRDVPDDISEQDWRSLRRRWDQGHLLGTFLSTVALVCLALSVVLS